MKVLAKILGWSADLLSAFLFTLGLILVAAVALPYRAWKERQIRGPPR